MRTAQAASIGQWVYPIYPAIGRDGATIVGGHPLGMQDAAKVAGK